MSNSYAPQRLAWGRSRQRSRTPGLREISPPARAEVVKLLQQPEVAGALMSGSGSTSPALPSCTRPPRSTSSKRRARAQFGDELWVPSRSGEWSPRILRKVRHDFSLIVVDAQEEKFPPGTAEKDPIARRRGAGHSLVVGRLEHLRSPEQAAIERDGGRIIRQRLDWRRKRFEARANGSWPTLPPMR